MKITGQYKQEAFTVEIADKGTVKDVLKELDVPANTVLVVRNKEVLLDDASLEEGDELDILSAISGG